MAAISKEQGVRMLPLHAIVSESLLAKWLLFLTPHGFLIMDESHSD